MAAPKDTVENPLTSMYLAMGEGIKYIVTHQIDKNQRSALMGRARRLIILLKDEKDL